MLAQVFPVEHLRRALHAVALGDALAAGELDEIEEHIGELLGRLVKAAITAVDHVGALRVVVLDVLHHVVAEAG